MTDEAQKDEAAKKQEEKKPAAKREPRGKKKDEAEGFTPPAEGADAADPYAHLGSNAPTGEEE